MKLIYQDGIFKRHPGNFMTRFPSENNLKNRSIHNRGYPDRGREKREEKGRILPNPHKPIKKGVNNGPVQGESLNLRKHVQFKGKL